jgi:sirohydrochlorin cobaltochelatase
MRAREARALPRKKTTPSNSRISRTPRVSPARPEGFVLDHKNPKNAPDVLRRDGFRANHKPVPHDDYKDAALVLVGHGATLNADSSAPTHQHADELRRRNIFAQVIECFWKEEPYIYGALRGATASRVFVVPNFISEGYFTEQVIPREMGFCENGDTDFPRKQIRGGQTFYYCGPVGAHDSMTDVIVSRATDIVRNYPYPRTPKPSETTLFIAGHGTSNNENSRKIIERQAELIAARDEYDAVHAIFMEEEPRIADCYTLAQTRNLVVVPFFISDGLHPNEDIPVMLGEPSRLVQERLAQGQPTWRNPTQKKGKHVWYTKSIGSEPHIADVILERVREMSG